MKQEELNTKEKFARHIRTTGWIMVFIVAQLVVQLSRFYARGTEWEEIARWVPVTVIGIMAFAIVCASIYQSKGRNWNKRVYLNVVIVLVGGVLMVPVIKGLGVLATLIGLEIVLIVLLVVGGVGLLLLNAKGKL